MSLNLLDSYLSLNFSLIFSMSDIVLHKVGVKFEPSKIGLEYTNGNDGISSFFNSYR